MTPVNSSYNLKIFQQDLKNILNEKDLPTDILDDAKKLTLQFEKVISSSENSPPSETLLKRYANLKERRLEAQFSKIANNYTLINFSELLDHKGEIINKKKLNLLPIMKHKADMMLALNKGIDRVAQKKLLEEKSELADTNMIKFLEEIEKVEQKKGKKKKIKRIVSKGKLSKEKNKSSLTNKIEKEPLNHKPEEENKQILLSDRLSNFALKLLNPPINCREHPRITRWKTNEISKIHEFIDKDSDGTKIKKYQPLFTDEIIELRAKHYLPGTEKIINSIYKNIYAFETNRGFGCIGQLLFNEKLHNGILYIGYDEKAHLIYHKYFEYIDFEDDALDFFQDHAQALEKQHLKELQDGEINSWTSDQDFTYDISEEGVLKFKYTDHVLTIYPLNKNLLKNELAKIKI